MVRADQAFRRLAVLVLVLAFAVLTTITVVLTMAGLGLRWFFIGDGLIVAAIVVALSRANLREVRVEPNHVVLASGDGSELAIPRARVVGLGHHGRVIMEHLADGPPVFGSDQTARIVLMGAAGEVLAARRAGWFATGDLRSLAAHLGGPWLGECGSGVPVTPLEPPAAMVAPGPGAAFDDPTTATAWRRVRTRRRLRLGSYVGLLAVGFVAGLLTGPGDDLSVVNTAVVVVAVIGWVAGLLLLFTSPLNAGRSRRIRRVLRASSWEPVEGLVLAGFGNEVRVRVVGVLRQGATEPEFWTVDFGGARGWLAADQRTWLWFAADPRRRRAAVANADRSELGLVDLGRRHKSARGLAADAYRRALYVRTGPAPWATGAWPTGPATGPPAPGFAPVGYAPQGPPPPPGYSPAGYGYAPAGHGYGPPGYAPPGYGYGPPGSPPPGHPPPGYPPVAGHPAPNSPPPGYAPPGPPPVPPAELPPT